MATSGSTGEPKGVVLTHDAVAASARRRSARLGVTADDHWLACLPLAHVGGLSVVDPGPAPPAPPLDRARRAFDAAAVADGAAAGATLVSLVRDRARAASTRALFRTIVARRRRRPADRPPNVVTTYGMTETGSGVVYDGLPARRRRGAHRRRRRDPRARADAAARLPRRHLARSTPTAGSPPATSGAWRADGRLTSHGRRGDLIITGGENVWPEPVERALLRHPRVADVAVRRPPTRMGTRGDGGRGPGTRSTADAGAPRRREGRAAGLLRTAPAGAGGGDPAHVAGQAPRRLLRHVTRRRPCGDGDRHEARPRTPGRHGRHDRVGQSGALGGREPTPHPDPLAVHEGEVEHRLADPQPAHDASPSTEVALVEPPVGIAVGTRRLLLGGRRVDRRGARTANHDTAHARRR